MARHSKWHKVRQFKGAIDARRAASFTKLGREITVAAREKGGDPNMNAGLRAAIDRAREASMPKDNIERAIQKGVGGSGEGQIESLTYEAYAPGGTALIIESLTDNRNRTANDLKHLLAKNGASMALAGSVTYLFDRAGVVRCSFLPDKGDQGGLSDSAELALIDAGATNIEKHEDALEIHSAPNDLTKIADAVTAFSLKPETIAFEWIPKTLIETDETTGTAIADLIEALEDHDDVSRVFSNLA